MYIHTQRHTWRNDSISFLPVHTFILYTSNNSHMHKAVVHSSTSRLHLGQPPRPNASVLLEHIGGQRRVAGVGHGDSLVHRLHTARTGRMGPNISSWKNKGRYVETKRDMTRHGTTTSRSRGRVVVDRRERTPGGDGRERGYVLALRTLHKT